MSLSLDLLRVSERQLIQMAESASVIRVGASDNIDNRLAAYRRMGYTGLMYFSRVPHMRDCEDRCLLAARLSGGAEHNFYDESIADNYPGFVYVIVGQWIP